MEGHRDMQDLTDAVTAVVRRSGLDTGLVHVHNVGSIEFEPGVHQD